MVSPWTQAQVLALAPDPSSAAAGRRVAAPGGWTATGACVDPAAVWGECRGSGAAPYRTAVDLDGPAFSCSCPSRKFPCKHALGLLLLWSAGGVPEVAEPAERVTAWLAARGERAARGRGGAAPTDLSERAPSPDPAAAAAAAEAARQRAQRREQRMLDGLGELRQWLLDQVRTGVAGTDRAGYEPFDALAARMVDAQVPAVAGTVRRLAATAVSGEGWPARLLEEYALLHLLAAAAPAALADPGSAVAATVRARLGVNVAKDDVLAGPAERDRWAVLARRDDLEDRLTVRRVWLRGERAGRLAVVTTFAPPGQPLDGSLVPGTTVDAEVHYYPGAVRLRALVGVRHATVPGVSAVVGAPGLAGALDGWAAALAADPWLRSWPVVLADVVPVLDGDGWWLVDESGALPLLGVGEAGWGLLAASGGRPVPLLAEVVPGGVRAVRVLPTTAQPAGAVPS